MLDDADIPILNALLDNSKKSRKLLANDANISESYLSKRVGHLLEISKVIKKFTISIDYALIGYSTNAISLIKLKESSTVEMHEIIDYISRDSKAIEVYVIFGDWDIFVRWMCKSESHLTESVEKIKDYEKVKTTMTVVLGKSYKRVNGPTL